MNGWHEAPLPDERGNAQKHVFSHHSSCKRIITSNRFMEMCRPWMINIKGYGKKKCRITSTNTPLEIRSVSDFRAPLKRPEDVHHNML